MRATPSSSPSTRWIRRWLWRIVDQGAPVVAVRSTNAHFAELQRTVGALAEKKGTAPRIAQLRLGDLLDPPVHCPVPRPLERIKQLEAAGLVEAVRTVVALVVRGQVHG